MRVKKTIKISNAELKFIIQKEILRKFPEEAENAEIKIEFSAREAVHHMNTMMERTEYMVDTTIILDKKD